jgi:hypothetical protein
MSARPSPPARGGRAHSLAARQVAAPGAGHAAGRVTAGRPRGWIRWGVPFGAGAAMASSRVGAWRRGSGRVLVMCNEPGSLAASWPPPGQCSRARPGHSTRGPRTGRTGPTATGASEVAMVGQASTWWFSADRRWHKGQPPPGWWQGPDRRWRPPTQAAVARPESPAAPPTAAEPVEATAGDGPSDARPVRGVRALHLKESPRRLWSRRHSP